MATRWRELFTFINVPWTDTGRNTARGNISIKCPFCDDPSQHFGINEDNGYWHCWRCSAGGKSPGYLLYKLGTHPRDIDNLLRAYSTGSNQPAAPIERTVHREQPPLAHRWDSFTSAAGHPDALAYLSRRHFPDPEKTVKEFDLRAAGAGQWARRLWFGLRDLAGNITGCTGRTLDDWRTPRYYTVCPEATVYLPKLPTHQHRLAIVTEGPMDALRVADATLRRRNILVIALQGLSATGNRRWQLSQIARSVPSFAVALDASVPPPQRERLIAELRAIPALGKITRLKMPADTDDPGEMTNNEVERWLSTL